MEVRCPRGETKGSAAVRGHRELAQRSLSYRAVGATLASDPMAIPAGYRAYSKTVNIGEGAARWQFASTALLQWGVKTRSGFSIHAADMSDGTLQVILDQRYWLIARLGPFHVKEPIQVITVLDEPDRTAFSYGTLYGHPVSGEEAFIVDRHTDDTVWLTIRSITQPTTGPWHLASPAVSLAQRFYRRRYLRALSGPT
jgi:uncharacterized protein (UPF0548 family)